MKVWKYESYEEYVAAQTEANKRKLRNTWVRSETIDLIAGCVSEYVVAILCHGTRNGFEQALFRKKFPHAIISGTEISDTAKTFPMTAHHDFHDPLDTWHGCAQIVYSNSLDHAYDPRKALLTWRDQLAPHGRLFIEYSFTEQTNVSSAADPLEISREELEQLFEECGLVVHMTLESSGIKGDPSCASTVFVLGKT